MVLLAFERATRNEYGKVAVLHAQLSDLGVEKVLDLLPNEVRPRTQDVAARHVVVLDELTFGYHLSSIE